MWAPVVIGPLGLSGSGAPDREVRAKGHPHARPPGARRGARIRRGRGKGPASSGERREWPAGGSAAADGAGVGARGAGGAAMDGARPARVRGRVRAHG